MTIAQAAVSDMLVTVKSRELQRGMLAEMSNDFAIAAKHFLAAAHLELVLANDYEAADDWQLAKRSRISAASCFWRAGEQDVARQHFEELVNDAPECEQEVNEVIDDLRLNCVPKK